MPEKSKWLRILGGILILLAGLITFLNLFTVAFADGMSFSRQTLLALALSDLLQFCVMAFVAVSLFIGKPRLIAAALSVSLVFSIASGAYSRISMLITAGSHVPAISNILYAVTALLSIAASLLEIIALFNCECRSVPAAMWIIPITLFFLLGLRDLIGGTYGSVATLVHNMLVLKGSMRTTLNTTRTVSAVLFVPVLFKSVCAAVWGLVNYGTHDKM